MQVNVASGRIPDPVNAFIADYLAGDSPCLIITAGRNAGKTTRFREVVARLRIKIPLTGVISESSEDKTCYRALNLITGEISPLMEESAGLGHGDFVHGRYTVYQNQFDACIDGIITAYKNEALAIDEVGGIELSGRGWFRLIAFAQRRPLLMTARQQFVDRVLNELVGERGQIYLDEIPPRADHSMNRPETYSM